MAQLIDSGVLIGLERRGQGLGALSNAAPNQPLAIASITCSELLIGIYRADTPDRRLLRESFIESVFASLPILPFDLEAARIHAELWAGLAAAGQMIGPNDLLIAATALAHGYGVLTENLREFERVPGLVVRRPAW